MNNKLYTSGILYYYLDSKKQILIIKYNNASYYLLSRSETSGQILLKTTGLNLEDDKCSFSARE